MIEKVSEDNFEAILNRGEGFIVNVWQHKWTTAHDLGHLSKGCRAQMKVVDDYPKFFASSLDEAQSYSKQEFTVDCRLCPNCTSS